MNVFHPRFAFLRSPSRRTALAGVLLTLMIAASVAPGVPLLPAGALGWIAALLLSDRLGRRQRLQSVWLIGLGIAGIAWGALRGEMINLTQILAGNQGLVSLLAAVSFLRLVTRPEAASDNAPLPRGQKALWRTLIGVHLFGAVINLSTVVILGDRMATRGRLGKRRALALSRGFAAAAFWSPFFSAMAAALIYAPGAQLGVVVVAGLPMAVLSLWLTAREIDPENPKLGALFIGYPMNFGALWIPGLLVAIVLIVHGLIPRWSILAIIALSAPVLSTVILVARERRGAWLLLRTHVEIGLAGVVNELTLFLAAGVLAAGLISLTGQFNGWLPFDRFGPSQAGLLLTLMVGIAALGVHPVISIAVCGVWLAPLQPDPNLLAITLLMAWAIGVPANPLSGLHLMMQGRYGIDGYAFLRWNAGYVLKCLGAAVVLLHLYGWLLHVPA
ncbi:MAG: hypothetical protein LM550_16790 [Candidatus Contendobacter sp.]|jgi:hypothetical protein|nr:hypothetical protein [Gammaproteobacteria bacterium]MCC8995300.1 hypothetical protein [Candidatus Contendobacter sp.]